MFSKDFVLLTFHFLRSIYLLFNYAFFFNLNLLDFSCFYPFKLLFVFLYIFFWDPGQDLWEVIGRWLIVWYGVTIHVLP